MKRRYLGAFSAALVFCLQAEVSCQVVIDEGVDYCGRRLSVSERAVDRGLAAYARARYLLTCRDGGIDQAELKRCIGEAVRAFPEDEELLSLLAAFYVHERKPEEFLEIVGSVLADSAPSGRFLYGGVMTFTDFFQRPDLAAVLLAAALDRSGWKDPGRKDIPMLMQLLCAALDLKACDRRLPDVLERLRAHAPECLASPRGRLLLAGVALQYKAHLRRRDGELPGEWQELGRKALEGAWADRRKLVGPEDFRSMLRLLYLEGRYGRLREFLGLPEIANAFGKDAEWHRFAILASIMLKQPDRTEALLRNALAGRRLAPPDLYMLAAGCERQGLRRQALQAYRGILAARPGEARARLAIARLCLLLDLPEEGIETLMPVNPLPVQGYLLLAHLWQRSGRPERGFQCLRTAERMLLRSGSPAVPDAPLHVSLGLAAYRLGRREEAVGYLRKAYRQAPRDAGICNSLGYVLADYDMDLETAERLLTYALANCPEKEGFAVKDSLAWLYYRQRRFREAMVLMAGILRDAGAGTAGDPEIRQHAAAIFEAAGLRRLAEFYRR